MSSPRRFNLTEAQMAGQLLIIGIDGTSLNPSLKSRLQSVSPCGIILFARNLVDAPQVAAFCRDLYAALPVPPFLAIDQEGGRVNRLKGIFPPIPPNLDLAGRESAGDLIRDHGNETGTGLGLLGFNLNFAPVLDLSDSGSPNGIGDRAYGSHPESVSALAQIFLESQDAAGVLGCGKHFPGLGGGQVDSHLDLPVISRSEEELWSEDLLPYRELRDLLPFVMVGHAYYPALQGRSPQAATLSRSVVRELLRERVGYPGVILTDDLEMGAIDQKKQAGEVVLQALDAGNDLVMYCKSWDRIEEAHAALMHALRGGALSTARVDESLARILALKERLPSPGMLPAFETESFTEVCRSLGRLGPTPA
jgi:beta-N-acetylhexosaminidase